MLTSSDIRDQIQSLEREIRVRSRELETPATT